MSASFSCTALALHYCIATIESFKFYLNFTHFKQSTFKQHVWSLHTYLSTW